VDRSWDGVGKRVLAHHAVHVKNVSQGCVRVHLQEVPNIKSFAQKPAAES
jgi:hypothetical protein